MKRTRLAAGILLTALAITATPAAHAETRSTVPPVTTLENTPGPIMNMWEDIALNKINVITPYPGSAPLRCYRPYRSNPSECWQQRPDGNWQKLIPTYLPQFYVPGAPVPTLPSFVYPVWEDPSSLQSVAAMSSI